MIGIVEKSNGAKASNSKKASYVQEGDWAIPSFTTFSSEVKKVVTFPEQWVKNRVIRLHKVEFLYSLINQDAGCLYHRRKGHTFDLCVTFIRIFNEKHKVGGICSRKEQQILTTSVRQT